MADMTHINDTDLAFFNRLASLASDRDAALPPHSFYHPASETEWPDHDAKRELVWQITEGCGLDIQDDYLLALECITEMAKRDGVKLGVWNVLHATELRPQIETAIAVAMILGALAFVSGEWLASLLPI